MCLANQPRPLCRPQSLQSAGCPSLLAPPSKPSAGARDRVSQWGEEQGAGQDTLRPMVWVFPVLSSPPSCSHAPLTPFLPPDTHTRPAPGPVGHRDLHGAAGAGNCPCLGTWPGRGLQVLGSFEEGSAAPCAPWSVPPSFQPYSPFSSPQGHYCIFFFLLFFKCLFVQVELARVGVSGHGPVRSAQTWSQPGGSGASCP